MSNQALTALSLAMAMAAPTSASAQAPVAGKERVYIAADDHTDYMWTGDEADYARAFVEMTDFYLDQFDRHADSAPALQPRWNMDGTLWLSTYERARTPRQFQRLIDRVRDGHMSFPLNTVVSTYGGTPLEAVIRNMYYAGTIERRFGLRVPMAMAMENQTLPYGLGAIWAGSGARYSWKGICGCLTQIDRLGQRPHEIYWWTGKDGSRILMKWNALTGDTGARTLGGYAEARTPVKEIARLAGDATFKERYPYRVTGIFGLGWDDLETRSDLFPKVAEAETTPARQVIVSNMTDFFEDFERSYGATLPNYAASFGNEWDLYTASVQELSSQVRRSVEKLRGAEALAGLVSLHRPDFMAPRKQARDAAWQDLGLFWEHNWTADGSTISRQQRTAWGRRIAGGIGSYVDTLQSDAATALGSLISTTPGARRFYAFNPLGWTRSDAVDIAYNGSPAIHVTDVASGSAVPFQFVTAARSGGAVGQRYLRIWASDLPSLGYRVYEVGDGVGKTFEPAAAARTDDGAQILENARYRIKVEPRGAITSLVDKSRGDRDFAGYVATSRQRINDLGLDVGTLSVEDSGPVSVTVKAVSPGPLAHESRITLYRSSARIDIRNDVTQGFDGTHDWGFTFNLKDPDVHHEETGAILRARLLAEGGDYAPTMSRLEWLTLNHFADMSGTDPKLGRIGVALSNWDLAFMKVGESEIHDHVSRLDTATPQLRVLAGGQIDAPQAGIPNQGGDTHFLQRFALQTHGEYSAAEDMRFALEHQNPALTGWVSGGGTLPAGNYSLLANSNPEVLLWALKPAEDGDAAGLVARVWNVGDRPQRYALRLTGGVRAAFSATHIETDIAALPVRNNMVASTASATQIQTIRMVPTGPARR